LIEHDIEFFDRQGSGAERDLHEIGASRCSSGLLGLHLFSKPGLVVASGSLNTPNYMKPEHRR